MYGQRAKSAKAESGKPIGSLDRRTDRFHRPVSESYYYYYYYCWVRFIITICPFIAQHCKLRIVQSSGIRRNIWRFVFLFRCFYSNRVSCCNKLPPLIFRRVSSPFRREARRGNVIQDSFRVPVEAERCAFFFLTITRYPRNA